MFTRAIGMFSHIFLHFKLDWLTGHKEYITHCIFMEQYYQYTLLLWLLLLLWSNNRLQMCSSFVWIAYNENMHTMEKTTMRGKVYN